MVLYNCVDRCPVNKGGLYLQAREQVEREKSSCVTDLEKTRHKLETAEGKAADYQRELETTRRRAEKLEEQTLVSAQQLQSQSANFESAAKNQVSIWIFLYNVHPFLNQLCDRIL